MQGQDIRGNGEPTVPASLPQLPMPYVYKGLTVEGVSPYRLTPRPNENITVPDEVGRVIVARNLARRFIESRIAIATAGLGVQPEALTVAGLVRALITRAGLVRVAVSLQSRGSLTPRPERLSDYATRVRERIKADHALPAGMHRIEGVPGADVGKSTGALFLVDDEVDMTAYKFGSGPEVLRKYNVANEEHVERVRADMRRGLAVMGIVPRDAADTEVEL